MTPKAKAKELVEKYKEYSFGRIMIAKQCALIAVEEIKKAIPMYTGNLNPMWKFFDDVENEIENI